MKFYNFTKQNLKCKLNSKDPSHRDIVDIVSIQIEQIRDTSSIWYVSHHRIQNNMLNVYHKSIMSLLKPYKSRKDSETYRKTISQFGDE